MCTSEKPIPSTLYLFIYLFFSTLSSVGPFWGSENRQPFAGRPPRPPRPFRMCSVLFVALHIFMIIYYSSGSSFCFTPAARTAERARGKKGEPKVDKVHTERRIFDLFFPVDGTAPNARRRNNVKCFNVPLRHRTRPLNRLIETVELARVIIMHASE